MRYLGSTFGLLGLLITVGVIIYFISLQFEQLGPSERTSASGEVQVGRVGDPAGMIESIDMAEDAAWAIEARGDIEAQFAQ